MKNVYRLIFHLLNSIFILSNFSQTISLYSLGGPSASRVCVLHTYHVHLEVWRSSIQGIPFWMGVWKIKFQSFASLKVTCESFVFDVLWNLKLNIRFGKSGHGKVSAVTMTDVMLSRVSESAANKNLLWTIKHGTRTVAKCAGKKDLTLSNPEKRAKGCSK